MKTKNQKISDALQGNKNAEKWTYEVALEFMEKCVLVSKDEEYDFIGEIAKDLEEDKGIFDYLTEKFPDLKYLKKRIFTNCEVNCFRNVKKDKINTAAGIINLKSNHGWTDRVANDNKTELNIPILSINPLADDTTDNNT